MLINVLYWQDYKVQLIFLMLTSLIIFMSGLLKYSEPKISFFITPEVIIYFHRNGQWQIIWKDIIRIGALKADVRGEHIQLPYLGIKLNTLENIAKNISPRLANKLLHEQQELFILAIKNREIDVQDGLINFEPYTLNDVIYKGPIAAWLYRTEYLAKAYGYHLYLPENSFDRDLDEFLALLKKCHHYTIVNSTC